MKFIYDGVSAHIQIAMQMSFCACYDANVRLGVRYDANAPL